MLSVVSSSFFFFNDTATTEIYTLSLHDALPISRARRSPARPSRSPRRPCAGPRSEEHTSELQSRLHLVCRLLLEKKKKINRCVERPDSWDTTTQPPHPETAHLTDAGAALELLES